MPRNYFRLRLSPEVVIGEGALVKRNGEHMHGDPVELIARHHSESEKSPYERLLGDAIRGDTSLFTLDDCVEAAWRVVDPVLTAASPVLEYEPGTWGPRASTEVVNDGDTWHDPVIERSLPC
jgi:glucose-6-phosphate 1-dehydrogenase